MSWSGSSIDLDVGAFRIDNTTGRITWANEACARIVGLPSASSVVGMAATDFYADPQERKEIQARLEASESFRKTGVTRLQVRRTRHDGGDPVDVTLGVCASFDDAGRIVQIDCTMEEASPRGGVENAFRASEARFRKMFDTSTAGMMLTDVAGHIQRVNAALCRLLGRSEQELLGAEGASLIHPEDRYGQPSPEAYPDGCVGQLRMLHADGRTILCIVSCSWLMGDDGKPHSLVGSLQDITELRENELRMQRLDKLESLGVLAGGIAHDFNNILAVILGNLSLATRRPDAGPMTREALAQAEEAGKRARELAQQLVTFAKGGTPVKRTASVAAVVREAAGFYLRGSNVAVELSVAPALWLSELDPAQMSQVLQNLFINAVQAMPHGGTVHVDAENVVLDGSGAPLPRGRYVRIRVRDEGVGIPHENLGRIFDPYFSTKDGGTGLGLAMAHSIVHRHGGHLSVESAPGKGTTFSVWLVASETAVVQPTQAASPRTEMPRSRVLVMDDEPGLRRVVAAILGEQGLAVDTTANGQQAVEAYAAALAEHQPYSVVILDLTVPGGLGGVETLKRLRALDPEVRAIVSTGYSSDPVMADCRAYGFVAAVPKPYTAIELESAVRDVVTAPREKGDR